MKEMERRTKKEKLRNEKEGAGKGRERRKREGLKCEEERRKTNEEKGKERKALVPSHRRVHDDRG